MTKIEFNDSFQIAFQRLNTSRGHLFITGKAGTGKSTLLTYFRENTAKKTVVLAPTGISALNVKGQTIHSFFGFSPSITPDKVSRQKAPQGLVKILQNLDTLVIDEVSMLRADLLDCIDEALRHHLQTSEPFGGVQMVFIGDLHQLPPVVQRDEKEIFSSLYASPYFFDAKVFENTSFDFIELSKVYRQKDQDFIELLNRVRNNKSTHSDLSRLNARLLADPKSFHQSEHSYITLTTTNKSANEINALRLQQLPGQAERYSAEISGDFEGRSQPTLAQLELKTKAQVMFLNNDAAGRWVNGSLGKIIKISYDAGSGEDQVHVLLEGSDVIVKVQPHTWELNKYQWNEDAKELSAETVGSFRQYPLRLAWAITIHKSQGKSFDKVLVDIGRGAFAHGQVYVALSRCRSLEGLALQKAIEPRHIWGNRRIDQFHRSMTQERIGMNLGC